MNLQLTSFIVSCGILSRQKYLEQLIGSKTEVEHDDRPVLEVLAHRVDNADAVLVVPSGDASDDDRKIYSLVNRLWIEAWVRREAKQLEVGLVEVNLGRRRKRPALDVLETVDVLVCLRNDRPDVRRRHADEPYWDARRQHEQEEYDGILSAR